MISRFEALPTLIMFELCCEMPTRSVQALITSCGRTNTRSASVHSSSMRWEWCRTKTHSGRREFNPAINTVCSSFSFHFASAFIAFYCFGSELSWVNSLPALLHLSDNYACFKHLLKHKFFTHMCLCHQAV